MTILSGKLYTESPKWHEKIGDIHALLERVKICEEQSGDVLHLRNLSRILSIHASTAIEGKTAGDLLPPLALIAALVFAQLAGVRHSC